VHALVFLPIKVFSRIDRTRAKPPLAGALNSVSLLATKLCQVRLYDVEDWGVETTLEDAPSKIIPTLIGDTPVSL
jgi:hypothetical protein